MKKEAYYEEVTIVCPFYKCSDSNHIKCEGLESGNTITLNFGDPKDESAYKNRYCRNMIRYHDCRICGILEEKWADDSK